MKAVTVQDVMSWNPCEKYTAEKVTKLFAGRETMTALDMLNLNITADDKLWAVLREDLIPAPILHEFACRCAEHALSMVDNPDPRSVAVIEAKRSWLRGEITFEKLSAAWAAAYAAAWAAAGDAARDAAYAAAAAGDAARDAAYSAAWSAAGSAAYAAAAAGDAARAAAYAAAYSAARDAAREQQIKILMELLESEG